MEACPRRALFIEADALARWMERGREHRACRRSDNRARSRSRYSALRGRRGRPPRRGSLGPPREGALLERRVITSPQREEGAIAFAERLLSLLEQGRFTATYKYALLLGITDVCLERTTASGAVSQEIPMRELARRVIELYWPHTAPFAHASGRTDPVVLRQNVTGQAEVVSLIARFRERLHLGVLTTITEARTVAPERFDRLIADVEWKLAEMPLPRLQLVGKTETPFLYEIGWDRSVKRRDYETQAHRAIRLRPGVGEYLVQLAGLLRPLVQRQWAAWIARQRDNRSLVEDAYLDDFLFGVERIPLERVRPGLRELQRGRCFYCSRPVGAPSQVDHFLPWSRIPDNGIDNLVLACTACNNSKRNYLAGAAHVSSWSARSAVGSPSADALAHIAETKIWERHPSRTFSAARAMYFRLPAEVMLWVRPELSLPAGDQAADLKSALTVR